MLRINIWLWKYWLPTFNNLRWLVDVITWKVIKMYFNTAQTNELQSQNVTNLKISPRLTILPESLPHNNPSRRLAFWNLWWVHHGIWDSILGVADQRHARVFGDRTCIQESFHFWHTRDGRNLKRVRNILSVIVKQHFIGLTAHGIYFISKLVSIG